MSRIPLRVRISFSWSRDIISASFLESLPRSSDSMVPSMSRMRLIDWEMVFQLVSMPPGQRWFT